MNPNGYMLSFDVEEWFHIVNSDFSPDKINLGNLESRVEKNITNLLEILERHKIKATFFILGSVAKRKPKIVKAIYKQDHEIATHGYNHKGLDRLSEDQFIRDVKCSKDLLEDIIGDKILGYRAPSFTINDKFARVLGDIGFKYDSSYFPSSFHKKYGDLNSIEKDIEGVAKLDNGLIEVPIPTMNIFGKQIPWGGGGYFRFSPYKTYELGARLISFLKGNFVFYLHSWEIDPDQPRLDFLPLNYRLRHYFRLNKTKKRLNCLLNKFDWGPIRSGLEFREVL